MNDQSKLCMNLLLKPLFICLFLNFYDSNTFVHLCNVWIYIYSGYKKSSFCDKQ